MKNFVQDGDVVTVTAPYALSSGDGCMVGSIFGVATGDALISTPVEIKTVGVYDIKKVSTEVWTQGQAIYWDNTAKNATNVKTPNKIGSALLAAANPSATGRVRLDGVGVELKVAFGQATTVAASDTIVTGLATVVSVVAQLDSDPTDDPEWVTSSIGDQAGTPAAGSFLLKSWKNTGGTDPTPVAATTFSKKVNWIAIGT